MLMTMLRTKTSTKKILMTGFELWTSANRATFTANVFVSYKYKV